MAVYPAAQSYRNGGGALHQPLRVEQPEFTENDYRYQQYLLVHGGPWDAHDEIPPRPWSRKAEADGLDARYLVEEEDFLYDQKRKRGA